MELVKIGDGSVYTVREGGREIARIDGGGPTVETRYALGLRPDVDAHLSAVAYGASPAEAMRNWERTTGERERAERQYQEGRFVRQRDLDAPMARQGLSDEEYMAASQLLAAYPETYERVVDLIQDARAMLAG